MLITDISFLGNCEEAIAFYKEVIVAEGIVYARSIKR